MNSLTVIIKQAEAFDKLLSDACANDTSFSDQAGLLTRARALRANVDEAALQFFDGFERRILRRLSGSALEAETALRTRLNNWNHFTLGDNS